MKLFILLLSWVLVAATMATAVPNPDEGPSMGESPAPLRPPEAALSPETGAANPDSAKPYIRELKTELLSWDRRIQNKKSANARGSATQRRLGQMELVRDELRADLRELENGTEQDWKRMRPAVDAKLNSLRHADQQVGSSE